MAKIPVYEQKTLPSQSFSGGFARPVDLNMEATGRALQGLGQAVGNVADVAVQVERDEARIWAEKTAQEAEKEWNARFVAAQQSPDFDPKDFTKNFLGQYDSYTNDVLKSTKENKYALNQLGQRFLSYRDRLQDEGLKFEVKENRARRKADLSQTINTAAVNVAMNPSKQNLDETLLRMTSLISESETLLPDVRRELIQEQRELFGKAGADAMAKNQPELLLSQIKDAREKGLTDTSGNHFLDLLPADQWDTYVNAAEAEINRREKEKKKAADQMSLEEQIAFSDTMARIETGEITGADAYLTLNNFLERNWITPEKRTTVLKGVLKAEQEQEIIRENYEKITNGIKLGEPVDVENKYINSYYEQVLLPSLTEKDPETALNANVAFINGTKSVPDSLKRKLDAFVLSDNPDNIRYVSTLVDAIDNIPGITTDALSTEQRAFISRVIPLMENMSPNEAIAKARELTDPNNKARVEFRSEELKKKKDYADQVKSDFEGWFGPEVKDINSDRLSSEYKTLYDAYYLGGMTEDAAREQAVKTMKRNWSEFNGYVMKYPPQNYYSVAGNSDYIMKQLNRDIATQTVGDPFEMENLFLVSDERTAKEANMGKPSYRVMIVTDEGVKPLAGFRWMPDMNSETKRIQEKNRRMKKLEGATVESIQEADAFLKEYAPEWYQIGGRSETQRIEDAKGFMNRMIQKGQSFNK